MLETESVAAADWRSLVPADTRASVMGEGRSNGSGGMTAAVADLEAHFQRAVADLSYAARRLDTEFAATYEEAGIGQLNPQRLLRRLQRLQQEVMALNTEGDEIAAEKSTLKQALGGLLLQNSSQVASLERSVGMDTQKFEAVANLERLMSCSAVGSNGAGGSSSSGGLATTDSLTNSSGTRIINSNGLESTTSADGAAAATASIEKENHSRSKKNFVAVSKAELASVSQLVRKRVKLVGVNGVYKTMFDHFQKPKARPLTTADMAKMDLQVTGQTGEAKLNVLRSLKIATITKSGWALL